MLLKGLIKTNFIDSDMDIKFVLTVMLARDYSDLTGLWHGEVLAKCVAPNHPRRRATLRKKYFRKPAFQV